MNGEQQPVPVDLAARRLSQYLATRDKLLSRMAAARTVLEKAAVFADDAPTLRALAEDCLAALAAELIEVLASNPERPGPRGPQPGASVPVLHPLAAEQPVSSVTSHYECVACGAAFGIAGVGTGSDDDFLADEYFEQRVAWHEARRCLPGGEH